MMAMHQTVRYQMMAMHQTARTQLRQHRHFCLQVTPHRMDYLWIPHQPHSQRHPRPRSRPRRHRHRRSIPADHLHRQLQWRFSNAPVAPQLSGQTISKEVLRFAADLQKRRRCGRTWRKMKSRVPFARKSAPYVT